MWTDVDRNHLWNILRSFGEFRTDAVQDQSNKILFNAVDVFYCGTIFPATFQPRSGPDILTAGRGYLPWSGLDTFTFSPRVATQLLEVGVGENPAWLWKSMVDFMWFIYIQNVFDGWFFMFCLSFFVCWDCVAKWKHTQDYGFFQGGIGLLVGENSPVLLSGSISHLENLLYSAHFVLIMAW